MTFKRKTNIDRSTIDAKRMRLSKITDKIANRQIFHNGKEILNSNKEIKRAKVM